jgi:predicted nucleic acid-binding protein
MDASFIATLIIPDEQNPHTDALYKKTKGEEIIAPQLIWYEIGNIFKKLITRKKYSYEEVFGFLPHLYDYQLITDSAFGPAYTETIIRIASEYGLSAYDAAYLELAGRKKAVLCTVDKSLREAAQKYGLKVLK